MRLFSRVAMCLLLAGSVAFAQNSKQPVKHTKTSNVQTDPGIKKYGNVTFADPEHHKYPIDNASHTRAAWRSINIKSHAAKYKPEELAQLKQRIHDAGVAQGIKFKDDKPETPKTPKTKAVKSSSK